MPDDKKTTPPRDPGLLAPVLSKWLNNQPLDESDEQRLEQAGERLKRLMVEAVEAKQNKGER